VQPGSLQNTPISPIGFEGQKTDTVLIMPSFSGNVGPIAFLLQPNLVVGTARGGDFPPPGQTVGKDYNVLAWGVVAYAEARLGIVAPFLGFFYGSQDDNASDDKLEGFTPFPQREITLVTGTARFAHLDRSVNFGRDVATPALAASPVGATVAGRSVFLGTGGSEFSHTVGNPFNDSLGNYAHPAINTTYSNPGTILVIVGVKIFPLQGHEVDLWGMYRAMVDSKIVEQAFGNVNIDEAEYWEIAAQWTWTLNEHFDIRLTGSVIIPGNGSKDIAQTTFTCGENHNVQCQGDDVALQGEARFRARF
jgi:hypothetical protein